MHEIFICQRLFQIFVISRFQDRIGYTEIVTFPRIIFTKFSLNLLAHQPLSYRLLLLKPAVVYFTSCTFTSNKLIKLAEKYILEADFSPPLSITYISLEKSLMTSRSRDIKQRRQKSPISDKLKIYQTDIRLTTIHYRFHSDAFLLNQVVPNSKIILYKTSLLNES
jgi:hypothetical protein